MLKDDFIAEACLDAVFVARFWSHVHRSGGCWIWTAHRDAKGYGLLGLPRRQRHKLTVKASRVAWTMAHGRIPQGMCVLHDCPGGDNQACVNPAHLWLGTLAENNADCKAKGRNNIGERHGMSKLNESLIRAIRADALLMSQRAVGAKYGVRQTAVSKIVRREHWKHVV